jgi:hypothetical protein
MRWLRHIPLGWHSDKRRLATCLPFCANFVGIRREGILAMGFGAPTGWRHRNGKPMLVNLCRAADTPIRRHVLVRGDVNLFDPA